MIKTESLVCTFAANTNEIRYPDLEIPANKTTFVCGGSGSGKSTLLKLFNGVVSPSGGNVYYNAKDISTYDTLLLRREVFLAGQSAYLFDASIQNNFNEYSGYLSAKHRNIKESVSREAIQEYLDICCVNLPLDSDCKVLSGGERQRVFMAINLYVAATTAKVIMLDEPTSALDSDTADLIIANIKSYCERTKRTLIVVSHDRTIADKYADNMIVLESRAENE